MQTFERIFVAINKWVVVLLLAAMSTIVFANVSLRYLSNFSITWAEEVARYLMIWMTFLGAGLSLRVGGHVAITNLHDFLGTRSQRALRAFVGLLLVCFFIAMMWIGYEYMSRMGRQLTPATRLPFSYIYAAMPIGFALMIVHFLLIARSYILGRELPTDGVQTEAAAG